MIATMIARGWFDLVTVPVAGIGHHTSADVVLSIRLGEILTLAREPENIFDKTAVRVEYSAYVTRIGYNNTAAYTLVCGYIPASMSPMISALLDHGYEIACTLDSIDVRQKVMLVRLSMPDRTNT